MIDGLVALFSGLPGKQAGFELDFQSLAEGF